jgi:hypothetical protein
MLTDAVKVICKINILNTRKGSKVLMVLKVNLLKASSEELHVAVEVYYCYTVKTESCKVPM